MRSKPASLAWCCAWALAAPALPAGAQVKGGISFTIDESGRRASYRIETNVFAIDLDASVDLRQAEVRRARIGPPQEREGCFRNPPLRLIVEGAEQFLRDGNYALRVRGRSARVIIGVLGGAPPARPGSAGGPRPADGGPLSYLILDEIELTDKGPVGQLGQSRRILDMRRTADAFELAPRIADFSACLEGSEPVDAALAAFVREKGSVPMAWVTGIDFAAGTRPLFRVLSQAPQDSTAIEQAIRGGPLNSALTGFDLAVAAVAVVPAGPSASPASDSDWRSVYTLASNTWDGCTPIDRSRLKCSNGRSLRIDDLVPRRFTSPIFWGGQNKLVYVTVQSRPSEADVFIGGARHTARTETSMDMPAQQIPYLRIEKSGFASCPYGARWRVDAVDGPRPTMTAFCALDPVGRSLR